MPSSMPPAAHKFSGKRIDGGRIELLSILGAGAYGVVYLGVDVASPTDRPTWHAVKCISKKGLSETQRTFQRRELTLHQLASDHPGVVTVNRVQEVTNWIFVIMDFCPEGDLFSMMTEQLLYLGQDALIKNVFLQIVSTVEHCHKLGIFHRDLKPENILCTNGGTTMLLADFGLATTEKMSDRYGCGSCYYMSPECQGGVYVKKVPYSTQANDIWALGVILVNLTCNRNPWKEATTKDETFCEYLRDRNFLRRILPISSQCNELLKRIFTINPDNRISIPALREAILDIQTFTMTEKELIVNTRASVVQQKPLIKPPQIKPKPQPDASSGSDVVPPLSPTRPWLLRDSGASSTSDGSLILTPEVQAIRDEPLAAVPEGDLDGEWDNADEVGQITISFGNTKVNQNAVSPKNQPGTAGRSFLSTIARKIRAL